MHVHKWLKCYTTLVYEAAKDVLKHVNINLTDFLAYECSDIGILELNVKTPHLHNRKIAQMRRVFFEELGGELL